MSHNSSVAVVGAGVIGLSWAALFAAKGHEVNVYDVRPDLEEQLQRQLPVFIDQVPGMTGNAQRVMDRVTIKTDLAQAVKTAQVIQESGPEQLTFKQDIWAQIEAAAPGDALLLSSSSGIVASLQAKKMTAPTRVIIGHPFNPPHILPLVEISADTATPQALINRVIDFYKMLDKTPIQIHKEVAGFVANRLQISLLLEAIRLVNDGVVSMKEMDDIVTASLGIRWASIGPLKAFHLGGGQGGLRNILTHIGVGLARAVGQPDALTEQDIGKIADQAEKTYPISRFSDYQARRDHSQAVIIADHLTHPVDA